MTLAERLTVAEETYKALAQQLAQLEEAAMKRREQILEYRGRILQLQDLLAEQPPAAAQTDQE